MTGLCEDDVYVSSVFIQASFEGVWSGFTEPLDYPGLDPAWTTEVEEVGEGSYLGAGRAATRSSSGRS